MLSVLQIDGEAMFIGTVLHSLDHTLMAWNLDDPLMLRADNPEFRAMVEIGMVVRAGFVDDLPGLYFNKRCNYPRPRCKFECRYVLCALHLLDFAFACLQTAPCGPVLFRHGHVALHDNRQSRAAPIFQERLRSRGQNQQAVRRQHGHLHRQVATFTKQSSRTFVH